MRLLIVRHAIAVPRGTPGWDDDLRPLTPRGRRRFLAAARGLAAILPRPGRILTSPRVRTRETADILAAAFGAGRPLEAGALAGGRFEEVRELLGRHRSRRLVAVVGHEPDISAWLARWLANAAPAGLVFRKGGAALLDLPRGPAGEARLVWYLPPRLLRRLAR